MLDIKFIRQNLQKVKTACQNRGVKVNIDELLKLDEKRRELIQKIEKLRARKKLRGVRIKELREKKKEIKKLEDELARIEKDFQALMYKIPNIPYPDVPVHHNEEGNKEIRKIGEIPKGKFKDYLEIAEEKDLIDIKRASKISGSRFGILKNEAALLEIKLIKLAFDTLTKEGFIPVFPPVMLKPEIMKGMGYLDQAPDEIYYLEKDNLYLVGTAEQSIIAMHANEIFQEKDLPKRYVGFSTCFRREAGSYGRDVKGIIRVHQFDKVEMISICKPEESRKEHQYLLSLQEKLVSYFNIPYRIMNVCTADLSFPSAQTFDLECWLPGQGKYRETHSTSNCTDFQARRLNIRYKNKEGKNIFVHTLNATAFAIGRMIIAILENTKIV